MKRFDVCLSHGRARHLYQRKFPAADEIPWESLRPEDYEPELVKRARISWTEAAFNEHCTGIGMGQLFSALATSQAPLDLQFLVSQFLAEELFHVELCSRVAARLGGGAPISYDPRQVASRLDPTLSPRQQANELIVRICCVGEALSFPLLSGAMRSATHPVTRGVLQRIVRDEALHGELGWMYLDWSQDLLDDAERQRLGRVATQTLDQFRPIWAPLSPGRAGKTAAGFPLEQAHALGWMEAGAYREAAVEAEDQKVVKRLAGYGIHAGRAQEPRR